MKSNFVYHLEIKIIHLMKFEIFSIWHSLLLKVIFLWNDHRPNDGHQVPTVPQIFEL